MKTRNKAESTVQADAAKPREIEDLLAIRNAHFRERVQRMADESGRSLTYYLEWCLDVGLPYLEEMHASEQAAREKFQPRFPAQRGGGR